MMCGAYTLALSAHVRADFVYIYLRPRAQAALDLALYFLFFIPGIIGLIYAGYGYAADSWRIGEHSNITAEGPPIYHFKTVIPICRRFGAAPRIRRDCPLHRVLAHRRLARASRGRREIDVIDTQLSHSEYVDKESRRVAMETAHAVDEAARHRSVMEEAVVHERAIKEDEQKKS